MKIAIIGMGKMGKEVERHAPASKCFVHVKVDTPADWKEKEQEIRQTDAAIEFTSPNAVVGNIKRLIDFQVPVITGTTGWEKQLDEVKAYCRQKEGSVFHASNFSIGVNLFFALNRYLTKLMAGYPDYKPSLMEVHHTEKLDAPSGTAISLLNDMLADNKSFDGWKLVTDNPEHHEVPVTAIREKGVTGTHSVKYESAIDEISIEHKAHNRSGFARGALMAARWMQNRKGIYTMNDLLKL